MRRSLVAVAVSLTTLLMAAGLAAASHSNGKGPRHDMTVGTGALEDGPVFVKLHVNAKSGPLGQDASGHFTFQGNPPPLPPGVVIDVQGRVTCLTTFGNRSTFGFEVTKRKSGPFPVGSGGFFVVEDGGEPGTNDDRFEGVPGLPPPSVCPLLPPPVRLPNTQGNLVVHDTTG